MHKDTSKLYMYNENIKGNDDAFRICNNIYKVKPEYKQYVKYENERSILTPYYNSDVVLASKHNRNVFCQDDYFQEALWEQGFMNWNIHRFNIDVVDIGLLWNGMIIKHNYLKSNYHDSYFLHYGGKSRYLLVEDYKKYYE